VLTLGELSRIDPRPLRPILPDAVHLADLGQRDYLGAVQHDQADAEMIGRMLGAARYTASLAKVAFDSGLPLGS
jgi:hypothetical protein